MVMNSYTEDEYMGCSYFYIDEDDVPELMVDASGDGRSTIILSFRNGAVIEADIWARGAEAYYKEKQNLRVFKGAEWNADTNYEICDVGHLENGEYVADKTFEKMIGMDASGNETYRSCQLNARDDEAISIHDRAMVAASLIKLFVYGAARQKIESDKSQEAVPASVEDDLRLSITISDNDACNRLIEWNHS